MTVTSTRLDVHAHTTNRAALARAASVEQALDRNGRALRLLVNGARRLAQAIGHTRLQWAAAGRG
ncbi:hypothetical protein [Aquabacterium sp. J223]|uniref:hypothetical protein n=1 Tax=Aquabacterium sp. J223 TaxID=2898431 RepID=UPI0021AD6FD6|nr:hypothetical protein [Aquabacterium sp. J223]UUX96013.1 hypothetical protein LRS07_01315 [Aquabacterium sp. J223]